MSTEGFTEAQGVEENDLSAGGSSGQEGVMCCLQKFGNKNNSQLCEK